MANPLTSDANGIRSGILKIATILGEKHYVLIMSSSYIRAKITTFDITQFEKLLSQVLHLFQN